jgi:anti-sigma factor RsiW
MIPPGERNWETLERIGAYAAGELSGEEARVVEQLIFDRPYYRRLAESYAKMIVMLTTLGDEPVEVPEAVVGYAIRRAYVSALMRSAETFVGALGRSYLHALITYLGLRESAG